MNDARYWGKEDILDIFFKIVLFFISPFISFLYSLRRLNTKSSYVFFFLFALFYGLCFTVIADNAGVFDLSDASRWRYRFEYTNFHTFSDYLSYCSEYFMFAGDDVRDLYFATVCFFVHLFSDNYHVFFLVISFVFVFFQLKSLRFLTSSKKFGDGIVGLFLFVLFTMNSIANIGGFRFWTAAWICVYALLEYFINNRKWALGILFFLPLIHRGFFFIYVILLFSIFYRFKKVWKFVYFFSFALSGISVYLIQDATPYLPTFLGQMMDAYSQNSITEYYSFTKLFLIFIAQIYINVLFVVIMNKRPQELPDGIERLYRFTLVFITIVNFVLPIPSLGGRFVALCYCFIAILWISIMGRNRYSFLIYLMPIFMIRPLYVGTELFLIFQEPSFFFTNPISLLISHLG